LHILHKTTISFAHCYKGLVKLIPGSLRRVDQLKSVLCEHFFGTFSSCFSLRKCRSYCRSSFNQLKKQIHFEFSSACVSVWNDALITPVDKKKWFVYKISIEHTILLLYINPCLLASFGAIWLKLWFWTPLWSQFYQKNFFVNKEFSAFYCWDRYVILLSIHFSICNKQSSLTAKNGKTKKNKVW